MGTTRKIVMGLKGMFMGSFYGRWNNLKFFLLLLGSCCWEDACQPHTVQYFMRSSRWKKSKDHYPSRKESWWQQGLNPWLQGDRPAPKSLSHEDLWNSRAWFFHYIELATCCEYRDWWKSLNSVQMSQADVCKACRRSLWTWCHQALVFSSAVTKKTPFLSHSV